MAEVLGVTAALLSIIQNFNYAFLADGGAGVAEHHRLLSEYSVHMRILNHCIGIIQSCRKGALLETVLEVAKQCAEIGQELAYRNEKVAGKNGRKRIVYALASFDKLLALHKDFKSYVSWLHQLVQSLILQDIQSQLRDAKYPSNTFETPRGPVYYGSRRQTTGDIYQTTRHHSANDHNQGPDRGPYQDWESHVSEASTFTVGAHTNADVVTIAEEMVNRSLARGVHFDPDPSLVLGTIAVTHELKPRFVPVRVKYDTASDVNFVPLALVEKNGLSEFMVKLEGDDSGDNVFLGLNNQEYVIHQTITLKWSAATMHNVRTTHFHVAEDLPYDMVLGNPFVQDNRVFHPQRVALPLRHKYRDSAHRKEEKKQKEAHDLAAAEELQRTRSEDARKRALEREARRFAKAQTSASAAASASRLSLHNQSSTAGNSGLSMTRSSTSASHTGTGAASAVFTPNLSHSTTMTTLDTASPSAPVTPKINNVPGPGFAKQPSATDAGANSE